MKKIAIEEHISRPQYMALRYNTPRGKMRPFPLDSKEIERLGRCICDEGVTRIEVMDRCEIIKCVLMSGSLGFDFIDDADEALKQTSEFNNFLLDDIVAGFPERYKAFVSLPFVNGEQAAEELRRCMKKPGCVGAVISGSPRPGKFIDESEFEVFWKAAEETGAYLYIHPVETPLDAMALYRGLDCLNGSTWSWGVDTSTYVLRMIFSGLLDRHPDTRIIMGHMGEMLPYVLNRIDKRWSISPMDSKNQEKPSEYMRKNIWITTSGNASFAALRCAIESVGADRIMFAVDFPFESMEEFSNFIEQVEISEEDRRKICWENAEKLFG
jgi:2,3-dihydroxybenzoate decarboxylase